jgi:hypothetical protein
MIKKYSCELLSNLNNEKLQKEIKEYIKEVPCCIFYPKCPHPREQSGIFLDRKFDIIKQSLLLSFKKYLNTDFIDIGYIKTWCFYNPANSTIIEGWHNHLTQKGFREISALCYLTKTNLGTLFKDNIKIIPEINNWYVWPSYLDHSPEPGYIEEERIVIACAIGIKNSI